MQVQVGNNLNTVNVLISLHRGYGLGDAVSMSSVLRHVRAARPHWNIMYRAEDGKHQVGRGIVNSTFSYEDTPPELHYDAEVLICLYDKWFGFTDKPNTVVTQALHDCFDLPWKPEYARYQINVSRDVRYTAQAIISSITAKRQRLNTRSVAVHHQGITARDRKDLTGVQANTLWEYIVGLDRFPLMLGDQHTWGRNADMMCAVIHNCEAFVGIDSGPAKCAGATDTPSLVVWTGHHPVNFYDPCPNVTHLIPFGCHDIPPVNGNEDIIRFFNLHYKSRVYNGDPVLEIKQWLSEVLK